MGLLIAARMETARLGRGPELLWIPIHTKGRYSMKRRTLRWLMGVTVTAGMMTGSTYGAMNSWYVATNGNGSAGTSWLTAYTNLQQALDAASGGDTIYIAGHTFNSNTTIQLISELVWTNKGLTILGGYAADGGTPGALTSTPTVLVAQPSAATNRILYISGVTNGWLQGVTIAGGRITCGISATPPPRGGGLYIYGCSNLTIASCTVSNNSAVTPGTGGAYGGGICVEASKAVALTNCIVERNSVGDTSSQWVYGGGISLYSGTLTIRDSVIDNNIGQGAIYGGGVYVNSGGTNVMKNCLIFGNYLVGATGHYTGYGITANGGLTMLENCTLAYHPGQALYQAAGTVTATNCILWGNLDDIYGTVALGYCDIHDGDNSGVNGCFSSEPQFQYGYYLTPGSPCVDMGFTNATTLGLDCAPRGSTAPRTAGLWTSAIIMPPGLRRHIRMCTSRPTAVTATPALMSPTLSRPSARHSPWRRMGQSSISPLANTPPIRRPSLWDWTADPACRSWVPIALDHHQRVGSGEQPCADAHEVSVELRRSRG